MLPALAGDGLWAVRGPLELSKGAPLLLWSQQRPPTPAPSKSWADGREAWASAECAAGKGCAHWPAQRHLRSLAWLSGRPFPLVFLWEMWVSNRDVQQWARERVSSGVVCVRTRVRSCTCQQSLVGPLLVLGTARLPGLWFLCSVDSGSVQFSSVCAQSEHLLSAAAAGPLNLSGRRLLLHPCCCQRGAGVAAFTELPEGSRLRWLQRLMSLSRVTQAQC